MSLYDSGPDFNLGIDPKKMIVPIAGITVIILLVLVGMWASENVKPDPLSMRFEKSPIKPGEQTKLFVNVTNISENDAENVSLKYGARENSEFDIYPLNEKFKGQIAVISKGASREITFIVNPVGNILPGTYTFDVNTVINGAFYKKEIMLTVQN